jgi:hypothetical protein
MVYVSFSREELEKISIDYLAKKGYYLKENRENQLIFTDGKDVDNTLLIILFLVLILGGFIYYLLAKTHTIIIDLTKVRGGLNLNIKGSTETSDRIAEDFTDILMSFDTGAPKGYRIQELKCPRCGSPLDYKGEKRFIKCGFCEASISINELDD